MPDAVAAAQTAEPIISLLTLTGGTMLIRPQIKVYWMWLYYLNPLHYCYEIVVTQSFQGRHGSHKPQETLDYFHYSNGHMGANFTWLVIWVLIRMVPIPSMLQSLWRADWAALDAVETVACVFCVVPILMNSWWFYLMLQGMWKQFCGSNDKKSGENAGVKKKK